MIDDQKEAALPGPAIPDANAAGSMERSRSACTLCGCGCAVTLERRGNRVVRIRPAENDHIFCAKRRINRSVARHSDRLTMPMVRSGNTLVQCSWEDALSVIATNLNVIKKNSGPKSIGCLGSVHTTNEDNYVFQKFARTVIGTNNVDMLARVKVPSGLNRDFFAGEIAKLSNHDAILLLGKDADRINPLIGVEIVRGVKREGRRLVVASDEPDQFTKIATVVIRSADAVTALVRALARPEGERWGEIARAALLLRVAGSVAIIVPSMASPDEHAGIRKLARRLRNVTYYPLVEGGNLQGGLDMGVTPDHYPGHQKAGPHARAMFGKAWHAILPDTAGMNAVEMIRAIGSGKIAALYIMGDDPVRSDPGLRGLLGKLGFLVVQDVVLTETAGMANVVLPAAGFLEKTGTITNLERRLRLLTKAEESAGASLPDWKIMKALANRMGAAMNYTSAVEIMTEIKSVVPMYRDLAVDACWPPDRLFAAGTNEVFSPPSLQSQIDACLSSDGCFSSQAFLPSVREDRKY